MAKGYMQLPTILNVAEGSTFTIQVPVGNTYDRIDLVLGGTTFTAAHILDLELVINGRSVRKYPIGSDLDAENQYWERGAVADGVLSMWFFRPELEEVEEANLLSLGTADPVDGNGVRVTSVIIKGRISGSTAPTLAGYAQIDTMPKPLGLLTKVLTFPTSAAASGDFDVTAFPKAPSAAILAFHFKKSDVNTVRIIANTAGANRDIVESIGKTVMHRVQTNQGFTPQSGFTHVNLIPHRQLGDALQTAPLIDLRARLTLGSSGALTPFVEYADTLLGI